MDCKEIRQRFIDFFSQQEFQLLPAATMLHPSIPMSFVMSAGLVQVETVLSELNLQQSQYFTLIQHCFRHFDLDTVGTTPTHLSLFEMVVALTNIQQLIIRVPNKHEHFKNNYKKFPPITKHNLRCKKRIVSINWKKQHRKNISNSCISKVFSE